MRKIFRKVHLWLAIPLGLIVFIVCLSGAILVFEDEIKELMYPERYFVKEVASHRLSMDELTAKVESQLAGNTVSSIQVPSDTKRNYLIRLSGRGHHSATVNPYTGDVVEIIRPGGFFNEINKLHRWLLTRKVGKPLVGYTTLLFVFILIAGIVIWWPRSKKQMKPRFRVKLRSGWRRFWYDVHSTFGMYAFIGLLILALTGLTYSFGWYSRAFYKVIGAEATSRQGSGQGNGGQQSRTRGGNTSDKPDAPSNIHWQTVFDKLEKENPNYRTILLSAGSAIVTSKFLFGNIRATDRYTFDAETGEITSARLYKDQSRASKARGWVYTLHVGAWGGLFSKIITCLIALIGGSLPLTGYYMFIKKRIKKKHKANGKR